MIKATRLIQTILFLAFAMTANAGKDAGKQEDDIDIKFYTYSSGVAADGYDVVAYFTEEKAVRGDEQYSVEWGDEVWHFVSEENKEMFLKTPFKYAPEYGGHCAYGVAGGYLVRGDPRAWSVENGKLYLNYSANVRRTWRAASDSYIVKSEANWPKLNR